MRRAVPVFRHTYAFLLLAMSGWAAPSDVTIYSNMSGSATGLAYGIGYRADRSFYIDGVGFNTGGKNFQLSQIQTIVSFVSGQNRFEMQLFADANGAPGALLETWNFSATANPTLITVTSVIHPSLMAGLQYWLTLAPADPASYGLWYQNPAHQAGPYTVSVNNGPFAVGVVSDPFYAINVTGVQTPDVALAQSKLASVPVSGQSQLGQSVSLSNDGSTVVLGGPSSTGLTGAAWVFGPSNGQWLQQAKLVPQGAAFNDRVGSAVAISGDENTILLGGFATNNSEGAVYVFVNQGGQWVQQGGKILGRSTGSAQQGYALALSQDGNTAVIGGPADSAGVGACWVFVRSGGQWAEQVKLGNNSLSGIIGNAQVGSSVAISGDGNTVLCSGPLDNANTGAVWPAIRVGSSWQQAGPKLVGTIGAFEGASVATNSNGTVAVIGGSSRDNTTTSVWTFTRSGTSWTQEGSPIAGKGRRVALDAKASSLVIGDNETTAAGEAWLFGRITGGWTPKAHLTASGAVGNAALGTSVALSNRNALVGGPNDNGQAGAAWAFLTSPAGTPAVVSVSPVVGNGSTQSYTFQFSDTAGWQTLGVVDVLINNYLDGRSACYFAYSVPDALLYLVPDSGGGPLAGMSLNSSGTLGNSQCSIAGVGSSASGSGSTLTLTLNLTFSSSFAGNKVVYAAARDPQANNTGWVLMGVHSVPPLPSTFPMPLGIGESGTGPTQTLTFTYADATSANNLQTLWALINTAIDGRSACYVAYYAPGNQLFLYPDNGDGTQALSMALTGSNSLSNSQCTVLASGSSYTKAGAAATLTLNITFSTAFAGHKGIWLAAQTLSLHSSDWQAQGELTLP